MGLEKKGKRVGTEEMETPNPTLVGNIGNALQTQAASVLSLGPREAASKPILWFSICLGLNSVPGGSDEKEKFLLFPTFS